MEELKGGYVHVGGMAVLRSKVNEIVREINFIKGWIKDQEANQKRARKIWDRGIGEREDPKENMEDKILDGIRKGLKVYWKGIIEEFFVDSFAYGDKTICITLTPEHQGNGSCDIRVRVRPKE